LGEFDKKASNSLTFRISDYFPWESILILTVPAKFQKYFFDAEIRKIDI
jgi:hypothetical protein